jgi:hypothetical protein
MTNFRQQRIRRNRLRFSEMGKASQRAQAKRREEGLQERIRELAVIEAQNLPRNQGDPLGSFTWTDFRTGKVRKWIVRIGARRDQITIEAPHAKPSGSHGWTWILNHLRKHLVA